jgi:hypothetical protein
MCAFQVQCEERQLCSMLVALRDRKKKVGTTGLCSSHDMVAFSDQEGDEAWHDDP